MRLLWIISAFLFSSILNADPVQSTPPRTRTLYDCSSFLESLVRHFGVHSKTARTIDNSLRERRIPERPLKPKDFYALRLIEQQLKSGRIAYSKYLTVEKIDDALNPKYATEVFEDLLESLIARDAYRSAQLEFAELGRIVDRSILGRVRYKAWRITKISGESFILILLLGANFVAWENYAYTRGVSGAQSYNQTLNQYLWQPSEWAWRAYGEDGVDAISEKVQKLLHSIDPR